MNESKVRSNRRFMWSMLILSAIWVLKDTITGVVHNVHSGGSWFLLALAALTFALVVQSVWQDVRDTNTQFAAKKETD